MSNKKLIFNHEIPIEIFGECAVSLEVLVNDQSMFKKNFNSNNVHKEVIQFKKEYPDIQKNKISFLFTGDKEVENKFLKINQICLNKQILNRFNSEYLPDINPAWWEHLSDEQKQKHQETIYGRTGSHYGWYGEINLYYGVGFDLASRFNFQSEKEDYSRVLGEKIDWIFLDEHSVGMHNTVTYNK